MSSLRGDVPAPPGVDAVDTDEAPPPEDVEPDGLDPGEEPDEPAPLDDEPAADCDPPDDDPLCALSLEPVAALANFPPTSRAISFSPSLLRPWLSAVRHASS